MNATIEIVPSVLDRIRKTLVGLKMPRALESWSKLCASSSTVKPVRWRSSTLCLPKN
jgi:hypothetical protein